MEAKSADNYESTGRQPQYPGRDFLPPRLQRMITEKRKLRQQWQRIRAPTLKTQLNALCEKLKIEMREYRKSPEMWRRRHRQRHVSPPSTIRAASTARYPNIVVETFPNLSDHLLILTNKFVSFYATCRGNRVLFICSVGCMYHPVVKYLKSIEATEPDLKYAIDPLHVCIRGIPDCLLIEGVQVAITERGYPVDEIKQITPNLYYVKICGGKDNTKILEMRELLNYKVRVELWKSGPVKREMEHTEPNESVTSTNSAVTSGEPPVAAPPLRPEYLPAQSTENQAVESEASSDKDTTKILEMRDLLGYRIKVELWKGGLDKKENNSIPNATRTRVAPSPTVLPLRSEYLSGPAPQLSGNQAPAPTAPLLWPQQAVLAGPSSGNLAQAASPIIGAITPEQLAALTAQITALTVSQIFGQHKDHNQ